MHLVTLAGSPSAHSRSSWLLQRAAAALSRPSRTSHHIVLRELPAEALLHADARHPALAAAIEQVLAADLLLVATPIYKAAYSGLLKTFLDLLPPDALRDKRVLPIATGGSPGHLLALDYALKPVLAALGARHIGDAVYVLDSLLPLDVSGQYRLASELDQRLQRALHGLLPTPSPLALEPA
ncbi:NADPH-dependent FMN reductase [Aquabacterium humicola]|uniref:NADPH-dependent FMN reductase n=1 Tax=Aquabacterium humicola TaxID=3237377 RepID=UPI0025428E7B|nr:NADPH-dependent FMN reductase [Rubrivivax pictus]